MQADTNSIIQTWVFGGQLLATTFTFIYLYKSLKAQNEANNLTNKKFIYDIKPIFKRTFKSIDRGSIHPSQFLNYTIVLTNNSALDISIEIELFKAKTGILERSQITILATDEEIPIIEGQFNPDEFSEEVIIKLKFTDEIGIRYEQKIHGILADLHITPPYKTKEPN